MKKLANVFIIYHQKDEFWKNDLQNSIENQTWQDDIKFIGSAQVDSDDEDFNQDQLNGIKEADVILKLHSTSFKNSNSPFDDGLENTLTRTKKETARIIPIVVSPSIGSRGKPMVNPLEQIQDQIFESDKIETIDYVPLREKYDKIWKFSDGLAKVKKYEKFGFINTKGVEVIPVVYDGVGSFKDGIVDVALNKKEGYVDCLGNVISPPVYGKVYPFSEGMARVLHSGKYGFINTEGKEVIPLVYEEADDFSEGWASVKKDLGFEFIDKKGKVMLVPSMLYNKVFSFHEGLARVGVEFLYGFIDKKGVEVIPLEYQNAENFKNGTAVFGGMAEKGIINKKNEVITSSLYAMYNYMKFSNTGFAWLKKGDFFGCLDRQGNEVVPFIFNKLNIKNGVSFLEKDDQRYIFRNDEQLAGPKIASPSRSTPA